MFILRLYRLVNGKLKVEAYGDFVERILNLCAHNGITVWGIRKRGERVTFYISVADFRRLRFIIRGSGIRVHIVKKSGLPLLTARYRHRYGIAVGIALYFLILSFLSGFIWNIKIVGNEKISVEEIKNACREIGIKEGIRASYIDAWESRVKLQTSLDEIAWAALNIEGCELTVDIKESKNKQEKPHFPCNLVASDGGVIRNVEVINGTIVVSHGDTVAKDDLLVSGIMELSTGKTSIVSAEGSVFAEVTDRFKYKIPLIQTLRTTANTSHTRYALDFFGVTVPLYVGELNGKYVKKYDRIFIGSETKHVPLFLHRTELFEIFEYEKKLTEKEAVLLARKTLNESLSKTKTVNISEKIEAYDDCIIAVFDVVRIKDIAKTEKILISTTN